jgi:hypothetical protein
MHRGPGLRLFRPWTPEPSPSSKQLGVPIPDATLAVLRSSLGPGSVTLEAPFMLLE